MADPKSRVRILHADDGVYVRVEDIVTVVRDEEARVAHLRSAVDPDSRVATGAAGAAEALDAVALFLQALERRALAS